VAGRDDGGPALPGDQDVDLGGNFYVTRRGGGLKRLRPDWVTIISGSRTDSEIDTELIGYLYHPGGPYAGQNPVKLLPEQVAHFAPIPDPLSPGGAACRG
jgi:hypothetical protein